MAQGGAVKHKKKTKSVLKNIPPDGRPAGNQSDEPHASAFCDPAAAYGTQFG